MGKILVFMVLLGVLCPSSVGIAQLIGSDCFKQIAASVLAVLLVTVYRIISGKMSSFYIVAFKV